MSSSLEQHARGKRTTWNRGIFGISAVMMCLLCSTVSSSDSSSIGMMVGNWKLDGYDNHFDSYLSELGVGFLSRKIALSVKPLVKLSRNAADGTWTMKIETSLRSSSVNFKIGESFTYETMDGRKVKATVALSGNVMTLREENLADKKINTVTRTFNGGKMTTVSVSSSSTPAAHDAAVFCFFFFFSSFFFFFF
ncbi:unnamed protein product [Notodromas monacha]|uniref:Lipocalin/cytosolic fatty-acid binding domain-containing protein n=1 Tax=Notodromas monacha TaxID=399045 RepID=A0A7R9GHP3_9CRUS|nr:unnamed protein product [Notodromas monacha]CAG0921706.1 unnamed protein product [Notodromas monacha]